MTESTAILVTLVLYEIALVGVGLWARDRSSTEGDYFLGGRELSPLVAAISASASSSSAWTLLGVSGFAYTFGLSAIWLFPACVGGFLLNWAVLAPRLRRSGVADGCVTTTDILAGPRSAESADRSAEDDTGNRARLRTGIRVASSAIILVFMTTYVASQFQGAGKTFSETFGLDTATAILIGSAVVVFYTFLGGFWAVSLTDTLQGLVMAATALLLPLAALASVGGPGELVSGFSRLAPELSDPFQGLPAITAIGLVAGLLGIGLGYPGQPHVVNRFIALRESDRALSTARRYAIVWAVIVYAGMLLVGWCGRVLFPALDDSEVIFLAATRELFPPVVAGVMVAAVLSAIMSTADSQLLVAASAVTVDLRSTDVAPRGLVERSRLVVLVLAILAVLLALVGPRQIFSPVLVAWSAMGAAFGPLLVVVAWRGSRLPPAITLVMMLTGLALGVAGSFLKAAGHSAAWERVVPILGVFLLFAVWSRIVRSDPRKPPDPREAPENRR